MEYRDNAFIGKNVQVNMFVISFFSKININVHIVTKLITFLCFRDICLQKEDHTIVITVLCTRMQDIPLEEVPPFVHQSLKLCTNQDSKLLLEALRRYFMLRFAQANSDSIDTFDTIGKKIQYI